MTLTEVSSCECCEIFKYTYFEEHLRMTAFAFKKAYIMHIINLAGKAYIMQVDYKATLGNYSIQKYSHKKRKETSHNLVSPTQADHNSRKS